MLTRDESREAARRQRERIEQARAVLEPSPVKLHHVPGWFRRRLLKAFPGCAERYRSNSGWNAVFYAAAAVGCTSWLDHIGSTPFRGAVAFCSEPYGLTSKELAAVEAIAKATDCDCMVSPNAHWYPGATLRILIVPCGDKAHALPTGTTAS